jgi:hypothetical protein
MSIEELKKLEKLPFSQRINYSLDRILNMKDIQEVCHDNETKNQAAKNFAK